MTEQEYKNKIAEYEKRMGIGEYNPAKEAYLVYVDILRQQTEFLKTFNIKLKITEKDDQVEYKNAKDLWENIPKLIENVNNLKIILKMEGEQKRPNINPISPKEIANGTV